MVARLPGKADQWEQPATIVLIANPRDNSHTMNIVSSPSAAKYTCCPRVLRTRYLFWVSKPVTTREGGREGGRRE
jgi:hypothetical protein